MTKRPAPRSSELGRRSPVLPTSDTEAPLADRAVPGVVVAPEVLPEDSVKLVGNSDDADKPKKDGFYIKPSNKQRAERARTTTAIHTGIRSWTAYVNEAVMAYTKQLEKEFHDSKPF